MARVVMMKPVRWYHEEMMNQEEVADQDVADLKSY